MKPDFDQLRDIHLPSEIGWWPPAPGWWLLLAMLLLLLIALVCWRRHQHKQAWRRQALAQLQAIRQQSANQQPAAISALLRRVAIRCFAPQQVASLNGEQWLNFLCQHSQGADFQPFVQALLIAPYNHQPIDNLEQLLQQTELWIRKVKPC